MKSHCWSRLLALITPLIFAAAQASTLPGQSDPLIAYVVLGERGHQLKGETVALLRIILDTPGLKASGEDPCARMVLSGPPGRALLSAIRARNNPDRRQFPISVCEAVLPFAASYDVAGETWTAQLDGKRYPLRLPSVVRTPEKALIVADTGCRDNKTQACKDSSWYFHATIPQDMAKLIARDGKATFMMVIGDVRYRGGKAEGSGKKGQAWKDWKADFFSPLIGETQGKKSNNSKHSKKNKEQPQQQAYNLLAMAPWVAVRGNHELCASYGSGGPGWFFLLDPSSPLLDDSASVLAAASCSSDPKAPEAITAPYRLDFDHRFSLLVTDSAAIEEGEQPDADQARALAQTLASAETHFKAGKDPERLAWWVTHKPVWAAVGATRPKLSNATQQAALKLLPKGTPPANVKLIASGHKHFYQSVEVDPAAAARQPLQLVIGNGGVLINRKAFNGSEETLDAEIRTASRYGFVEARLEIANGGVTGWTLNAYAYPRLTAKGEHQARLIQTCSYPVQRSAKACRVLEPAYFPVADADADAEDDQD